MYMYIWYNCPSNLLSFACMTVCYYFCSLIHFAAHAALFLTALAPHHRDPSPCIIQSWFSAAVVVAAVMLRHITATQTHIYKRTATSALVNALAVGVEPGDGAAHDSCARQMHIPQQLCTRSHAATDAMRARRFRMRQCDEIYTSAGRPSVFLHLRGQRGGTRIRRPVSQARRDTKTTPPLSFHVAQQLTRHKEKSRDVPKNPKTRERERTCRAKHNAQRKVEKTKFRQFRRAPANRESRAVTASESARIFT